MSPTTRYLLALLTQPEPWVAAALVGSCLLGPAWWAGGVPW